MRYMTALGILLAVLAIVFALTNFGGDAPLLMTAAAAGCVGIGVLNGT